MGVITMTMKKRAFALIFCLMLAFSAFVALADEAPGYVQYVDALQAEEPVEEVEVDEAQDLLDHAYAYIDGYADAIQADENNNVNIAEAVK